MSTIGQQTASTDHLTVDVVALGGAAAMMLALAGQAFGNLRQLAEREPYNAL